FAISFVLLLLDQASKQYMSSILPLCQPGYCQSIEILPIFKLTVVHNEGAAFSFLSDAGGWQRWLLVSISIFASLFVAVWLYRVSRQEKLLALALAFILGGALGNLVDRALLGYVVDFIVVYYESYYFPAFNVADSAITIGAGFLILDMFINYRKGVDE
ncbi:MAG TPA: signal peptidase II, partial [Gammaproteobacteria bacterium]|nr:signal peptidase II [Gammaproteobacteria bacterium]